MTFPLPPNALDQNLVFDFFWKFSAFECALKREGFLCKKSAAEADWSAFGKKIKDEFDAVSLSGFQDAAAKLRALSPRKQMNDDGRLAWMEVKQQSGESNAEYTLHLLKIVRNNLFHGGKYPDGHVFEITRNREILRTAPTILNGCYELHLGVKNSIDEVAA
jgi:hypothetical protein